MVVVVEVVCVWVCQGLFWYMCTNEVYNCMYVVQRVSKILLVPLPYTQNVFTNLGAKQIVRIGQNYYLWN